MLIPFQNGQRSTTLVVPSQACWAALLGWGLGWARTGCSRWCERIGADLRTTTYEHLLRLSLDYFGGKRTGDLMSRIGGD